MAELPTGTVTFLFTDVEGSTALWEREPVAMRQATARHDVLIEAAVAEQGGVLVRPRGEGDSRFAVFARASDAVAAALALQRALVALQSLADTYPLGEEPQHVSYLMGLSYSALSRHDDAVESYSRAAKHNPNAEILFRLADAQFQSGRMAQARHTAGQALALNPQHQPCQMLLDRLASTGDDRLQR